MSAETRIAVISTERLVDRRQIGWVAWYEGDALVWGKIISGGRYPFLSLPTVIGQGNVVAVIEYVDMQKWREKARALLRRFREEVGDEYFFSQPGGGATVES